MSRRLNLIPGAPLLTLGLGGLRMRRQPFKTHCLIGMLCLACLSAPAAVQERDWTLRTGWGPVGIQQMSYTSTDSIAEFPQVSLQFCFGPLGKIRTSVDTAKDAARWAAIAPVLFAIGVFAYVRWIHRRERMTIR